MELGWRYCETVFQVAHFEGVSRFSDDLAEIVNVRSIGKHIGDLKSFTAFRVRVTRHNHRNPTPSQVKRTSTSIADPFNLPGRIAKGDKLLKEFGVGVLDVIDIKHDIVTHF